MLTRVPILSPNYSSRGGASPRIIVIHSAEGASNYRDLGAFFQNTSAQVSSHVGIDDHRGEIGEYVRRQHKAWTCAAGNPVSLNVELCGWARWTSGDWDKHPNMLHNLADWVAEEAKAFSIPIVKLTPQEAQGNGRGVCQHRDLGAWGGGHVDAGPGFPIDRVLQWARGATITPPAKAPGFPFVAADYLGVNDGTSHWHDGHGGGYDSQAGVRPWQQKMWERGWTISVDGVFGQQSANVAKAFQRNKGLASDGKVGPVTWKASWETPVK